MPPRISRGTLPGSGAVILTVRAFFLYGKLRRERSQHQFAERARLAKMQNAARIEKSRWSPGSPVIRRRILLTRTTFCTGRQRAGNGEARQHAFLVIRAIPQRLKELA